MKTKADPAMPGSQVEEKGGRSVWRLADRAESHFVVLFDVVVWEWVVEGSAP
jgi:hypothetical protein